MWITLLIKPRPTSPEGRKGMSEEVFEKFEEGGEEKV